MIKFLRRYVLLTLHWITTSVFERKAGGRGNVVVTSRKYAVLGGVRRIFVRHGGHVSVLHKLWIFDAIKSKKYGAIRSDSYIVLIYAHIKFYLVVV